MRRKKSLLLTRNKISGFTLIELLIVVSILSIIATIAVLLINPAAWIAEARDVQRFNDLESLNKTISSYTLSNGNTGLGDPNLVYLSLPDTDGDGTCNEHLAFLPDLTSPKSYRCVPEPDVNKSDGAGWIPLDLANQPGVSIPFLPIDPVNNPATGPYYYSYVTNGSEFEVNVTATSDRYSLGGTEDKVGTDGGDTPAMREAGSSLNIHPWGFGAPIWQATVNYAPQDLTTGFINGIEILGDHVYVSGYNYSPGDPIDYTWIVQKRLRSTGSLVAERIYHPADRLQQGTALSLSIVGSFVYVVGPVKNGNASEYIWRVEKLNLLDLSLVDAVQADYPGIYNYPFAMKADSSGIYVSAIDLADSSSKYTQRVEKWTLNLNRDNGNVPVWSQTFDPTPHHDLAYGIDVDGNNLYLAALVNYRSASTCGQPVECSDWIVEARSKTDGTVVWSAPDPDYSISDHVIGANVEGGFLYTAGISRAASGDRFVSRIEKRAVSDGSLVYTKALDEAGLPNNAAYIVLLDGNSIYIPGFTNDVYPAQPRKSARYVAQLTEANGSIVSLIPAEASPSFETIFSMAQDDNSLYTTGPEYSSAESGRWHAQWLQLRLSKGMCRPNQSSKPYFIYCPTI